MNITRRKALEAIYDKLVELRDELESIKDEEQEYADNMPENLQGGERHEAAENAVYGMEDALSDLESAADKIEEVFNA